jgi:3-phosphoshikimate 1-carboxyvinyltransferase
VAHEKEANVIRVPHQLYQPKSVFIESDWSAASYYYEMAAFAGEANLELRGLLEHSFQGDADIAGIMQSFGVETSYGEKKIFLRKSAPDFPAHPLDLSGTPDLAPALFATAAGLSKRISFTGLEHLAYKESHREEALQAELKKCGINVTNQNGVITVDGIFSSRQPEFATYKDHRMAMALAPLAIIGGEVQIDDPMVVNKSYPQYWDDLKKLGFSVSE